MILFIIKFPKEKPYGYMKNKYRNTKIWKVECDSGYPFILMDISVGLRENIHTHFLKVITYLTLLGSHRNRHHHLNSSPREENSVLCKTYDFLSQEENLGPITIGVPADYIAYKEFQEWH